jgi:hypothetical protein
VWHQIKESGGLLLRENWGHGVSETSEAGALKALWIVDL